LYSRVEVFAIQVKVLLYIFSFPSFSFLPFPLMETPFLKLIAYSGYINTHTPIGSILKKSREKYIMLRLAEDDLIISIFIIHGLYTTPLCLWNDVKRSIFLSISHHLGIDHYLDF